MNTIYKVLWKAGLQMFQVVSELAKGKTKSKCCRLQVFHSLSVRLPKIAKISNICLISSIFVTTSPFVWADDDITALKTEVASLKTELEKLKNTRPLYFGVGNAPTKEYIEGKGVQDYRKNEYPSNNNENGEGAGKNKLDSNNYGAIAIGYRAFTTHGLSTAIGVNSYSFDVSLAVGTGSAARSRATAIGINASAENRGTALGFNTQASNSAIAIGENAVAGYFYEYIHGKSAMGMSGIAIGQNANSKQGIAIGDRTKVNTEYGIAIGGNAKVKYNGVALGESAAVWENGGVALGTSSVATRRERTFGYIPNVKTQPKTQRELATFLGKNDAANFAEEWKTEIAEYDAIMKKVYEINHKEDELVEAIAKNKGGSEEQEKIYQKALEEYKNLNQAAVNITKERYEWESKHKEFLNAKAQRTTDLSTYLSTDGAVSVGNIGWKGNSGKVHSAITRQITNLAAGSEDTDAVNVAQLKALATLPVSIYNGGGMINNVFKLGTAIDGFALNNLSFSFGDGLKVEKKDVDGKPVLFVGLDREKIQNDATLKGEKGEQGLKGEQGERGPKGEKGDQGKSAYESWKELPANQGKSETEFAEVLGGGASKVELQQLRTEHDSLKAQIRKDQQSIQQLDRNMQKMNKDLRAGIAGATAIAFLQGGNFAGESAVSVAVGTYKGEHALAVGYGRRLTNNKIEIKLGASVNSQSDVNAGGSVGYHW